MTTSMVVTGVVIEGSTTFTLVEVCDRLHIPKELVVEMMEQGLLGQPSATVLNQQEIQRMEAAIRLHRDLDINLPGVALALDLLDELEELRKELAVLRRHV